MTWEEKLEALANSLWTGAIGALTVAALWVVRNILTSKTQIALVRQEISSREENRKAQRVEDLEAQAAIRREIAQVRADITDIKVRVASIRHEGDGQ